MDWSDINGKDVLIQLVRREIAERRNFMLIGPMGHGKTLIARRAMNDVVRSNEITATARRLKSPYGPQDDSPPQLRTPHHTAGQAAMFSEFLFASGGILVLDEVCLFKTSSILAVRDSMRVVVPDAHPLIIVSADSCFCEKESCTCEPEDIVGYYMRILSIRKLLKIHRIFCVESQREIQEEIEECLTRHGNQLKNFSSP